eukprot:TRINITY_DN12471_c0_g1_i1.p1 TRINITY_DN12471_c0_g1~~TRINITY_DN12471_c0_g1_i1.p1  ORF type:complete len:329 (+),score=-15.68 TRINITY_DN12471_c0_g1_i1:74-1060(+)
MKIWVLIAVCAVTSEVDAGGGGKRPGFQTIPNFYTSGDCTGPIDAESKNWLNYAQNASELHPFAVEGAYMPTWVYSMCLFNIVMQTYSVKVVINDTACTVGDPSNQFQLLYFEDQFCERAPVVVPMTLGKCVRYPRGSILLRNIVSAPDLCVATKYVTAFRQGGIQYTWWGNPNGVGAPAVTNMSGMEGVCTEQECNGCCQPYDGQCVPEEGVYTFEKSACTLVGGAWQYWTRLEQYTDPLCRHQTTSSWGPFPVRADECFTLSRDNMSARFIYADPMTPDILCQYMAMALRNNIDATVLSWEEFNAANSIRPWGLLLVAVVVAISCW